MSGAAGSGPDPGAAIGERGQILSTQNLEFDQSKPVRLRVWGHQAFRSAYGQSPHRGFTCWRCRVEVDEDCQVHASQGEAGGYLCRGCLGEVTGGGSRVDRYRDAGATPGPEVRVVQGE